MIIDSAHDRRQQREVQCAPDRNSGDAYGNASLIAQCDPLGEALGAHRMIAKIQPGGSELNVAPNTCQRDLLRAAGALLVGSQASATELVTK